MVFSLLKINFFSFINLFVGGWRDDSRVKSSRCSSRGPSTHVAAHNCLQFQEVQHLLLTSMALCTHTIHIPPSRQNTLSQKTGNNLKLHLLEHKLMVFLRGFEGKLLRPWERSGVLVEFRKPLSLKVLGRLPAAAWPPQCWCVTSYCWPSGIWVYFLMQL